jgi:hypothetical protein
MSYRGSSLYQPIAEETETTNRKRAEKVYEWQVRLQNIRYLHLADIACWIVCLTGVFWSTRCGMWGLLDTIIFLFCLGLGFPLLGVRAPKKPPLQEYDEFIKEVGGRNRRYISSWICLWIFCLLFAWLPAYQFYCDKFGGECMFAQSLANANSCTKADFSYAPITNTCNRTYASSSGTGTVAFTAAQLAQQAYHPLGHFPSRTSKDYQLCTANSQDCQPFYTTGGIYAFCYMDQHWALPTRSRNVPGYLLGADGDIDDSCTPTAPGIVSLEGCNGAPCDNAYPDPTLGVNMQEATTRTLSNETINLRSCPGNTYTDVLVFAASGIPVPLSPLTGRPLATTAATANRTGRPLPICPVCLWYWMTQVAGTPDAPYSNTYMEISGILSTCLPGWTGGTQPTGRYVWIGNNYIDAWFCNYCPTRTQALPAPAEIHNGAAGTLLTNMQYDDTSITAYFWFTTVRTFIFPAVWIAAWYVVSRRSIPLPEHLHHRSHQQNHEHHHYQQRE